MPLQATSGAASYDAFGGGVAAVPNYIEDVFSTYLYTGNGSTQTITNGIDLSTKGGLIWTKGRSAVRDHKLVDTARGAGYALYSNTTDPQVNDAYGVTGFNANGYNLDLDGDYNGSGVNYVGWTFRKAPKFFDVVTYTGNGTAGRTVAHNLGSTPACIIVKCTSSSGAWTVYHRSTGSTKYLILNNTDAADTFTGMWNNTDPTATEFTLGASSFVNQSGQTFVAYLFAHDAGGFGLTGTDNVISCGTFAANNGEVINLGYEPQWLLYKDSSSTSNWRIADTMRGFTNLSGTNAQTIKQLSPNTSSAESDNSGPVLTSTGFTWNQSGGGNVHIYIAIRRGPMKVPTSGTSVFAPVIYTGDNTSTKQLTSGFPIDLIIGGDRSSPPSNVFDRLRGVSSASPVSYTASTADEQSSVYGILGMTYLQTGDGTVRYQNSTGVNYVDWFFRRAPSFFDEVCYTGTGVAGRTVTHNLTVAPELMFIKSRSAAHGGLVYNKTITASKYLKLFFTGEGDRAASNDIGGFYGVEPTSSVFTVGGYTNVNQNGSTYVAYLFATCVGVSKVGTYTGTGTTLQIDCGFTGGARFVLIKRTDSTGSWYVWDVARGISSGNDPYLLLNSTAAEVTNTDYIDTYSAGFEISSTAPAEINASGGSFIFLAIS